MSRTWDKAKTGIKVGALGGAVLGAISGIPGGPVGMAVMAAVGALGWGATGGVIGAAYGAVTDDPKPQVVVVPAANAGSAKAYYAGQDMTPDLSTTRFQDMAAQQSQTIAR